MFCSQVVFFAACCCMPLLFQLFSWLYTWLVMFHFDLGDTAPFSFVFFVLLLLRCIAKRKKRIYSLSVLPTENYIDTVHFFFSQYFFFLKKERKKKEIFYTATKNINEIPASVCWASVFFAVFSPNIVVIMTTVLGSGQKGGRSTLKALQSQCPLTRSHIDFGKVHRTELHSPDKVSCSVLCTETQMQAYCITVLSLATRCHTDEFH